MKLQDDVASLVDISTQKWPPRQRTYLGSRHLPAIYKALHTIAER